MDGLIKCPEPVPFAKQPDLELFPGVEKEDSWKQLPAKIIIGDGITFVLIISLEFHRDKSGDYLVQRVRVQEELLEFFEQLPVCVGLGVATDVTDVEWFFHLISGRKIELKRFI